MRTGQQWRSALASWKRAVIVLSVVIAHTVLAVLAAYALYRVLALGFIGLPVVPFWAVTLMGVTLVLAVYTPYLSAVRMTARRVSSLLLAFTVIGVLTAMVTSPDHRWWTVHFSQLGTFDDPSSAVFNGTLIAGGHLLTTFAVYIENDMTVLPDRGLLHHARGPQVVPILFAVMGVMLACVGVFPVDEQPLLHDVSASGMAVVFLALLIGGLRLLRGMPRSYFVSSSTLLGATVASTVLFVVRFFTLTSFEILVFALVFGWIALFVRFLGVTGQRD